MTENKRFKVTNISENGNTGLFWLGKDNLSVYDVVRLLNELNEECEFLEIENEALEDGATKYAELCHKSLKENEQLKEDIENLKITIKARETLIDVCEKKFNELGYIITVDDDGYVIE